MLEPELKPIPPQPNCHESMRVYEDHRLMAADFLEVQKQLQDMRSYKKELEDQLRQSEIQMEELAAKSDKEEVKKFIQLSKEKVRKLSGSSVLFCQQTADSGASLCRSLSNEH